MSSNDSRSANDIAAGQVTMIAAAWFARMRSDERSPDDERRFAEWLESDPGHEAAYASICDMWEASDGIADRPGIKAMRLTAIGRKPLGLGLLTAPQRRGAAAAAVLAAFVALAFAGMMYGPSWLRAAHGTYQTAAGERASVVLDDGTLVTLTSDSRLIEDYSPQLRRVRLERGEAYFDVMRDPNRPFVVEAGSGQVTALGTEFDVYKKNGEVVVTLIEGRVEVAALDTRHTDEADEEKAVELRAGEQVSYDKGKLSGVREVDTARAIAWRSGRLRVLNEPLDKVAAELNRHSKRKLYLDKRDPRIKNILLSGSFSTDRPEGLVAYLTSVGYQVWVVKDSSGNITLKLLATSSTD